MSAPQIAGRLGFAEVGRWLPQADALAASPELDLSQVEQVDSAGLALLLELTRRCRTRGGTLRLRGARPQLRALARFFGLDPVLQFEEGTPQ